MVASTLAVAIFCTCASAEPMTVSRDRIFIRAQLNGVATRALLDSAAEATLVDPVLAAAARLGAGEAITIRGSGGTAAAHVVAGARVEALDLVLHPDAIVVTDLTDISRRLAKRPVSMVLGREIFDAARLLIDFRARSIERLGLDAAPEGVQLTLSHHAGIETIPVSVNGRTAHAEFDLGNGSDILMGRQLADLLKLKAVGYRAGGGIGGKQRRAIVIIERLEVAGRAFRHVRAAIDEQPNAGELNIGTRILRHFRVTAAFAERQIWLKAY